MRLLTSLAACEFALAEHLDWVLAHGVEPLQPLSPHWLPLVRERSREFRLAAALNSLRPIEENSDLTTVRAMMEPVATTRRPSSSNERGFDDGVSFSSRTEVDWETSGDHSLVWENEKDVAGLQAILTRRLAPTGDRTSPTAFEHVGQGRLPASLSDIDGFLAGDTNEADFSRLAFVLSMVDASVVEPTEPLREGDFEDIDAEWAQLKLALSRPQLPDGEQLPVNRDIHLLALRGDRESALDFSRAHLRAHSLDLRDDLAPSARAFDRIVAACAFPISAQTTQRLIDFVTAG